MKGEKEKQKRKRRGEGKGRREKGTKVMGVKGEERGERGAPS